MRPLIVAASLLALFSAMPAAAQENPVEITADRFVIREGQSEAEFIGNVVVVQEGLTIYADKLLVLYGPGGASDLQSFEATGNVKLVQPDQTATGQRGVYDPETEIMRLTGNVAVTNESGTVRGPELVVNFKTGISQFEGQTGSGGRVTGVFGTGGE